MELGSEVELMQGIQSASDKADSSVELGSEVALIQSASDKAD